MSYLASNKEVINKIREWQLNNIALEVTFIVDFHSSNYYSLLQYNETKLVAEVPEVVKDLRTAYRYVEGAKGQRTKQSIALQEGKTERNVRTAPS